MISAPGSPTIVALFRTTVVSWGSSNTLRLSVVLLLDVELDIAVLSVGVVVMGEVVIEVVKSCEVMVDDMLSDAVDKDEVVAGALVFVKERA